MPDQFVAATWNMGGGEPAGGPTDAAASRVLTMIHSRHVSIFLGVETHDKPDREVIHDLWPNVYRPHRDSLVAWSDEWTAVHREDVILNPNNPFFRKGQGDNPVYVHMPVVILCDAEGRTITAGAYHLASSVQDGGPVPKHRIASTREAMRVMTRLNADAESRARLFGGDDNVDEDYGDFAFMLGAATGLRQLQAPGNTLGRRQVDDLRIAGLAPVGDGWIVKGPTHHNAYGQKLRWRDV